MDRLFDLAQSGTVTRLAEKLLPEIYIAKSVGDFLRNKEFIRATNRRIPLGSFFNGSALVKVGNCVVYYSPEEGSALSSLTDTGGSLEISFHRSSPMRKGLLKNGSKLYHPFIFYHPDKDSAELLTASLRQITLFSGSRGDGSGGLNIPRYS